MEADRKKVLIRISGKEFEVPVTRSMTLLDALIYIKENLDHTLSFRYHCRMGSCGSCAVVANGKPVLACITLIEDLGEKIEVKPLYNYKVIRDLVVDQEELFARYRRASPAIEISEKELAAPPGEHLVKPEEQAKFVDYAACINCGLCLAACPTVSLNEKFLGPHAITALYRYYIDPRDEGWLNKLLAAMASKDEAIWNCHYTGACSRVCPRNVDPASAIQLLKKEITVNALTMLKRKRERREIVKREAVLAAHDDGWRRTAGAKGREAPSGRRAKEA